jgi:hypothetical protein
MDRGDDCPTVEALRTGTEDDIIAPEPPARVVARE